MESVSRQEYDILVKKLETLQNDVHFFSGGVERFIQEQVEYSQNEKGIKTFDFSSAKRFTAAQIGAACQQLKQYTDSVLESRIPEEPYQKALANVNLLSKRVETSMPIVEHYAKLLPTLVQEKTSPNLEKLEARLASLETALSEKHRVSDEIYSLRQYIDGKLATLPSYSTIQASLKQEFLGMVQQVRDELPVFAKTYDVQDSLAKLEYRIQTLQTSHIVTKQAQQAVDVTLKNLSTTFARHDEFAQFQDTILKELKKEQEQTIKEWKQYFEFQYTSYLEQIDKELKKSEQQRVEQLLKQQSNEFQSTLSTTTAKLQSQILDNYKPYKEKIQTLDQHVLSLEQEVKSWRGADLQSMFQKQIQVAKESLQTMFLTNLQNYTPLEKTLTLEQTLKEFDSFMRQIQTNAYRLKQDYDSFSRELQATFSEERFQSLEEQTIKNFRLEQDQLLKELRDSLTRERTRLFSEFDQARRKTEEMETETRKTINTKLLNDHIDRSKGILEKQLELSEQKLSQRMEQSVKGMFKQHMEGVTKYVSVELDTLKQEAFAKLGTDYQADIEKIQKQIQTMNDSFLNELHVLKSKKEDISALQKVVASLEPEFAQLRRQWSNMKTGVIEDTIQKRTNDLKQFIEHKIEESIQEFRGQYAHVTHDFKQTSSTYLDEIRRVSNETLAKQNVFEMKLSNLFSEKTLELLRKDIETKTTNHFQKYQEQQKQAYDSLQSILMKRIETFSETGEQVKMLIHTFYDSREKYELDVQKQFEKELEKRNGEIAILQQRNEGLIQTIRNEQNEFTKQMSERFKEKQIMLLHKINLEHLRVEAKKLQESVSDEMKQQKEVIQTSLSTYKELLNQVKLYYDENYMVQIHDKMKNLFQDGITTRKQYETILQESLAHVQAQLQSQFQETLQSFRTSLFTRFENEYKDEILQKIQESAIEKVTQSFVELYDTRILNKFQVLMAHEIDERFKRPYLQELEAMLTQKIREATDAKDSPLLQLFARAIQYNKEQLSNKKKDFLAIPKPTEETTVAKRVPEPANAPLQVLQPLVLPIQRLPKQLRKCFFSACIANKGQSVDRIGNFSAIPGWDFILFTNLQLPTDTPWTTRKVTRQFDDPAMDAKMYKWLSHTFLPEYDIVVWIDAYMSPNLRTIAEFESVIHKAFLDNKKKILHRPHLERDCIWDECEAVVKARRAKPEEVEKNRRILFEGKMPRHFGLFDTNILARMNRDSEVQYICTEIFEMMKKASNRDQLAVTYIYYKYQFKSYFAKEIIGNFVKSGVHVRLPAYL